MNGPPNAAEGPGKGPQQSGFDDQLGADGTGPILFERHSRFACSVRSNRTEPCHTCCRCWRRAACEHPEFSRVLEVVS